MPRLKWHKLRQRRDDTPFLRANLAAGLAGGAAMEVDLSATADGDFVCVHDTTLDRETTGTGLVGDWTRQALAKLPPSSSRPVSWKAVWTAARSYAMA